MKTRFTTTILGFGKHASIEIPEANLKELGGSKRVPLKVTVNGHTYQSTATGMGEKCLVVFPMKDREAAGVDSGDTTEVLLELDAGYRDVEIPPELLQALTKSGLKNKFDDQIYSKRKEAARQVADAVAQETKERRITKILDALS